MVFSRSAFFLFAKMIHIIIFFAQSSEIRLPKFHFILCLVSNLSLLVSRLLSEHRSIYLKHLT